MMFEEYLDNSKLGTILRVENIRGECVNLREVDVREFTEWLVEHRSEMVVDARVKQRRVVGERK
jgi:hypothetical protein